jgi:EF-hand domain pair
MKLLTTLSLGAMLALSGMAATAGQQLGSSRMAALDTDKDQQISRQEAAGNSKLAGSFDAIDANRDGMLDAGELRTFAKARKSHALGQLDTNQDGVLTREEAASSKKLMANWDMIDTDKDGRLSSDELRAAKPK